ncbi:MAG: glycosidase [Sphingomonadaceae bacterium]|nr:glycosidase [Sphingomonadaceae bacterium]
MSGGDRVESNVIVLDFNVEAIEMLEIAGPPELMKRAFMSGYVWASLHGGYEMLMRARPCDGAPFTDTGVIWHGTSADGRFFTMDAAPVLTPGPGPDDIGGCEDPTPAVMQDGSWVVYYTGVLDDFATGQLLYAVGPSLDRLTKMGVALPSTRSMGNTKEATVTLTDKGFWRLFYEYARDNASAIGLARGDGVAGPWHERQSPIGIRPNSWDNWHLSTGPLLLENPEMPVMFYNGATRDARWRIGWAAFDSDFSKVVARGIQPLITPPPVNDRAAIDIAFASSVVVEDGRIWLYYSLEDAKLARALIRKS